MEPSRLAQFEKEMEKMQIAIAGISEMRWKGSGTTTTTHGNLVVHSGSSDGGRNGVGIYVSKQYKQTLISWNPVSDRIITARFRCNSRHITIVQCYAPTEDASDDFKDDFYNALTSSLTKSKRGAIKILMGDFNAKLGPNNNGLEPIMGRHGVGTRSNNGDRLADLCQTFQLVIGGTVFPHKEVHKYTWTSPSGHTRNQIDHLCISRKWRHSLSDVRNRRSASIDSDHELLVGELLIKLRRRHTATRRSTRRPPPLNLHRLGDPVISTRLATMLREQLTPQQNHTWEHTCSTLRSIAEGLLGTRQRRSTDWISTRTWELISRRNSLKSKADHDCRARDEYKELCKLVKKSARNDKRALIDRLAENAESAANANNMRSLYQTIGKLSGSYQKQNHPVRDVNGTLLVDDDSQIRRWRQHFLEISHTEHASNADDDFRSIVHNTNTRIPHTTPSVREIRDAIRKLKNNKAAGEDGLPAELLQVDSLLMAETLHPHFESIWENEQIPPSWKKGIIVKLPKKGDLSDCNNWRGITQLNTSYKVLATLLNERQLEKNEPTIRDEQGGFRPHRSCVDQANTLRAITEQAVEWRAPLYLLFIEAA
ncbi:uncharacterized protein LOC123257656 [Drosophila ananassae]|uniref:uncharacterized protein LOC123257656 n=1 Tax=Drosophila ananassae TaxID=7217 RepID=UPI001CFFDA22|nr:uncharacterized protein LOC123257656 [Drosophila ananassae]